ncbi:MAG: HNH endonuclease [Pseudomonadota bacterium]
MLDPFHFERLMQAPAQARHHLGDLDLSASQLLLFLAEEWLTRRAEAEVEVEPEPEPETAHVCHDRPTTVPEPAALEPAVAEPAATTPAPTAHVCHADPTAAPILQRVLVHRCPVCDRAWSEGRAGPMELDPRHRAQAACDAEELAGDASAGTPGHLSRSIPPAVRRAVLVRDGGRCQVPGCRNRRHVEVHHLTPRSAGGGHTPQNLVTLCSCHHDMVHRGGGPGRAGPRRRPLLRPGRGRAPRGAGDHPGRAGRAGAGGPRRLRGPARQLALHRGVLGWDRAAGGPAAARPAAGAGGRRGTDGSAVGGAGGALLTGQRGSSAPKMLRLDISARGSARNPR